MDDLDMMEPIVFVMLTCAFYYGCDDLDVIGLTYANISMYRPSKWLQLNQAAPRAPSQPYSFCTNLGPFTLQLCGVDFEVKNFFAENLNEKIPKSHSVQLVTWKVQFSPQNQTLVPVHRPFTASSHQLNPNNSWMDREVHYGEAISVCFYQQLYQRGHLKNQDCSSEDIVLEEFMQQTRQNWKTPAANGVQRRQQPMSASPV